MCVRAAANHSEALEMWLCDLLEGKMAQNRVILDGNSTRVLLDLPGELLSHILLWIQGQFVSFGL
jgi:hypothetical protein